MITEFDQGTQNKPEMLQVLTEADIEDFMRLMPQLTSKPPTAEVLEGNLRKALAAPDAAIFVIRDGQSRIQASATANTCRIPTGVKPWVDDVVTDKDSRGKGYGRSLMEALHEWFLDHGVTTANLTSAPFRDEAGNLYTNMGYVERDTRVYRKQLGEAAVQDVIS